MVQVFHNLRTPLPRLLRVQSRPSLLLLLRRLGLVLPRKPRLGHLVLRSWVPAQARLRYHPRRCLLRPGCEMAIAAMQRPFQRIQAQQRRYSKAELYANRSLPGAGAGFR